MMDVFSFFDMGFIRLVFNLFVDYMISAGYLLPQQRQQWVDGWSHVIGILGGVIFMAIWQYHSHKKDLASQPTATIKTTETYVADQPDQASVLKYLPNNQPQDKNTP